MLAGTRTPERTALRAVARFKGDTRSTMPACRSDGGRRTVQTEAPDT